MMNFGWIPPRDRTATQQGLHERYVNEMPAFDLVGAYRDKEKAVLWECSLALGGHFLVFRQETGSCVGNGGGQAVWYLSAAQAVRDRQRVLPELPFYLLPYGRSRYYAGMLGEGEGSFGSAMAKALKEDGIVSAKESDLPRWDESDGITWGQRTEMKWSAGEKIPRQWLDRSQQHLVKTASPVTSADQAIAALQNYYPLTCASDWGGRMQCSVAGNPPVLLNEHVDQWMHQMCCIGYWRHPELGDLFYILNSWGPNAHGRPPDDAPPGGFWIRRKDMEYIIGRGEVFALSQFVGFPAQADEIEYALFDLIGAP